ncbi:MAG: glycosyltransferase family 39 protein [Chloroflexi bacterium]|nr:glycosyltransferase family 39 protein [Chloroflexota bacterium]
MKQEEMGPSMKRLLAGLAAFLWLGLLVGGYFWAHKPFDTAVVTAVSQTTLHILTWLILTWLCTSLGFILLSWLNIQDDDTMGHLLLAAGLGLGLLAVLVSLLGFAGLFRPWAAWVLVLGLSLLTLPRWRQLGQAVRQIHWPQAQTGFQRLIVIYAAASLLLAFVMALTPVTAWDSLTYHLVGPKLYIQAGRFVHPLNIPQLGFPLLGQMHFTLGMLLVGDGVAALFHFGYGLLVLALAVVLARKMFGDETAWLAALVLLSVPTFFTLISWPYVDVTLMFYTTAVFYTFFRWQQTRQTGWLVVMGMMIGFSGGLKYTAVATPIAITISLIWISRKDGVKAILGRLLLVGGIALVLVTPWLLENYVTTGNPVYPFFLNNGKFWDDWWAWWYDLPGTGFAATAPWRLLTAPLEATIAGTEGSDFYEATIGPLILGALFLLPLVWRKFSRSEKALAGHMLLLIGLNYALWLNGLAHTALLLRARFLFLIWGVTAVLAGLVLAKIRTLKSPALDVAWLVQTILSLTLVLLLVAQTLAFLQVNPLPVVVGLEDREAYLFRQLGVYHTAVQEGVNTLPEGSSVMMLWETRTYACQVVCHPDPILGRFLHLTQHLHYDAAAIRQTWEAEGVTHVLMSDAGLQFLLDAAAYNPIGGLIRDEDLEILADLTTHQLRMVHEWDNAYTLYEWAPQ